MASIEEILSGLLDVLQQLANPMPKKLIVGYKENIGAEGVKLVDQPTPIKKAVVLRVRAITLPATYLAVGDGETVEYRLIAANTTLDIDFVDDLMKVVIRADANSASSVEWIGG